MAKKFVKRTDANNEILYFYTHSDVVDVGEGNNTTSLTAALNNKANTSDVQALSDDALRKSSQSLSSQEKEQVHNNIGTESFVDDRAVRYDDAQVLGSEEKTQALTNLGLNGVDDEPTPNSDNLVKSGGVFDMLDTVAFKVDERKVDYNLGANGKFGTNTAYFHAAIKVNAGEKYLIRNVQPDTATESFTRYAFVTSDEAVAGGDVPLVSGFAVVVVPLWKGEIVTIPEGCEWLLVNYRDGNTSTLYPLYVRKIVIGESESLFRQLLTRSISWNNWYIVDYNHIYNFKSNNVHIYEVNREYNTIIIPLPRNAMCVTLPNNFTGGSIRVFSEYEINQEYELGSAYQNTYIVNGRKEIWFTDKYTEDGTVEAKMLCFYINKSNNPDVDYNNLSIGFKFAPDYEGQANSYAGLIGKKVSILGASIDTYMTYSWGMKDGQKETSNRYPGWLPLNDGYNNDVYHVSQTWWKQVIDRCGATLERNNSIGGSGVTYDSESLNGRSCFLRRYMDLGNPDVIIVHGLSNEHNTVTWTDTRDKTMEELEAGFGTAENPGTYFNDLGASYDYLVRKLIELYPNARILHYGKSKKWNGNMKELVEYYGQESLDLLGSPVPTKYIGDGVHPNREGMKSIADYFIYLLSKYVKEKDFATKKEFDETAVKDITVPSIDDNIATYITDKQKRVIGRVEKDGSVYFDVGGGFNTSKFENIENYTQLYVDKNGKVICAIDNKGKVTLFNVHLGNAEIDNLKNSQFEKLVTVNTILSLGLKNPGKTCDSDVARGLLLNETGKYEKGGSDWHHKGVITIIDDDTSDYQIPVSQGKSAVDAAWRGGFFSLLYPMLKALGEKHGINIIAGLAMEGHRVGLTKMSSADDTCEINENGVAIKKLQEKAGWNVFCHSMTARLPEVTYNRVWIVDSLNAPITQEILYDEQGTWHTYVGSLYSFYTTQFYDRETEKNYTIYQVDENTRGFSETPLKYVQPYYIDPLTNIRYWNESFPVDYQVGEWKRRAEQLGFKVTDGLVHWGRTTSARMIREIHKYFNHSIDPTGSKSGLNVPPLASTVHRVNGLVSSMDEDNVYSASAVNKMKTSIERAASDGGWVALMTHFNTKEAYNGYYSEYTYPERSENYNSEWRLPIKRAELLDMIGDNVNNYWETPPPRLGITHWSEWEPALGTKLRGLWDVLEYAISQGVMPVSPEEAINEFDNAVAVGTYRDSGLYSYENKMQLTSEDKNYLIIGADGSIKYYSE